MDEKIVSLRGDPLPQPGEPHPGVVAALESLLDKARAGEVIGLAVAAMHADRASSWGLYGLVGSYSMVGALDVAQARLRGITMSGS